MAINKRKVLDAARKHAQKGAKQKALKEYNKLVQADSRDAKLLLEIGDVYRRWGQAEEAIAQYTKVANQYKQDGFDARAVAVLKQILNLDPKRYTAHVSLAELYQRMGLDSDAVAALRTAADGYYREGRRKEALELLRKMAALDPANTTSRLKVADLLHQEGMDDEAVGEFGSIIEELRRQGANEQVCVVLERVLELRPDDVPSLTNLAQNLSDLGQPERAEPFAVRALERSREAEQFELLGGIYKSLGNEVKLAEVTRELAAHYKERGDEDRARDVMQRLPLGSAVDGPGFGLDRSEVDESEVGEDELLEDEDFLVTDATDQSDVEALLDEPGAGGDGQAGADVSEDDLPDGDPEQLLAEASVYLRYGKRPQAIASLRSALRQEPEHRGALEKLGEAYAEDDRHDDAIGCWQQAAEIARRDGDAASFGVLRDRIGALDPEAGAAIAPMDGGAGAAAEAVVASPEDLDATAGDDDLDFDIDVSETVDVAAPAAAEENVLADAGDDAGFEIDMDADLGAGLGAERPVGASADAGETASLGYEDEDGFDIDVDLDIGESDDLSMADASGDAGIAIDLDAGADELDSAADAVPEAPGPAPNELEQSTSTAAQIREDLEEAEFYLQQGLEAEAEGIYQRILSVAPNHPTALLKLGELAAVRGDDPGVVTDPGTVDINAATVGAAPDDAEAEDFDLGVDVDIEMDGNDAALADSVGIAVGAAEEEVVAGETSDPGLLEELSANDDLADALASSDVAQGASGKDAFEESGVWKGPELSDDLAAVLAEAEAAVDASAESGEVVLAAEASIEIEADDNAAAEEEPDLEIDFDSTPSIGDQLGDDATEVETLDAPDLGSPASVFAPDPVQAEPDMSRALADDTLPMGDVEQPAAGAALAESSRTVGGAGEAMFDLAAELADVFEDANAETDENSTTSPGSTVEDGFESLFADFKKGVSATLDEGDYDTRFDLGIAYREMGLFGDAIGEFTACLGSPDRKLESLHMMALCAMKLGRPSDAVSHLEQALATEGLEADRTVALHFDLGRAQRHTGDVEAARRAFETVERLDASFPGLTDELAALAESAAAGGAPVELASSDEEWESFTDIMGDDDDDQGPVAPVEDAAPETFESFDDVITDVEAADAAADAETEAPDAVTPDDETGSADAGDSDPGATRSGRKKKISFV